MKHLKATLPSLALVASMVGTSHAATKPNIIFVISDDHRWDCIGAAGNPNIHTPNLDRLAKEGLYFKDGTIYIPQCSPSRSTLLTGLASHTNGRYSNQTIRKDIDSPTGFEQYQCTPKMLADAGYQTTFVGKWHVATDPWNTGFQVTGTWMPAGAGAYKGANLAHGNSRETTKNPDFTQKAFGESARKLVHEYSDAKSTRPLFMWLAFTAPHSPYQPNPDSATLPYKDKKTTDVFPPTYIGTQGHYDTDHWLDYVAAITSVDEEMGMLMKTLDETGMSSNTVIAFIGDNGYMMGNRDLHGKVVPWEDSVRVPFMIWGPGVFPAKGNTDALASSIDLPPTFMKLAGAEPPAAWHGRDLTPVLQDGKPHDITWSVSEFPDYDNWKFPGIAYRTVRNSPYKLIAWNKQVNKAPEFYDIVKDPEELKNLYSDPAAKPNVDKLQGILDDWMKKTNDDWTMHGDFKKTEFPKDKKGNKKKTDDD